MSRTDKEALSALLDNEADDLELRRLLQDWDKHAADEQADLAASWARFQLVKDVLHGQEVARAGSIADRVQAQLVNEAVVSKPRFANWQQNMAKFAIAASVAAVFVVGVQSSIQPGPQQPQVAEQATQLPVSNTADSGLESDSAPVVIAESTNYQVNPEAEQRMRDYFQAITVDASEPAVIEHIQDSPLYRLVNQRQEPQQ